MATPLISAFSRFALILTVSVASCFSDSYTDYLRSDQRRDRLPDNYLLGTHLCRYPQPPLAELKRDMEILKRAGFNLIKIQTHWAIDERVEGTYDFSAYEPLIAYAEDLGLGVYIGLTCEQAPAWLYAKYPDARMVGRNGVPVIYEATYTMPADGKPGPCFLHEGARAAQDRYIRAFVKALAHHKNIVVWNTWQETANYSNWSLSGQSIDYSRASLVAFLEYLKNKYKSLDILNRAWSSTFGTWEQVGPNRDRDLGLPQDVDWKFFMENVYLTRTLEMRRAAIRETDPLHRPIFAHLSYPVIGSTQNWTHARAQDFMGTSHYPAWGSHHAWDDKTTAPENERAEALRLEQLGGIAINTDYLRSSLPGGAAVWAAEMQAGPVAIDFHKGRTPDPGDIRRWMLGSVAGGSTSIVFWVTRAEIMASENNGFSLLDSEGDTTPRFEEAARIGRWLGKYPSLFAKPTLEPAEIGLLVDEQNYQFCNSLANLKEHLNYDLRGWYGALWQLGFPVDFVSTDMLSQSSTANYRVLILPFSPALSAATIEALTTYVKKGGHLICEAAPGRIDERGLSVRGEMPPALEQLFGVTQRSFQLVHEPQNEFRWSPKPRTWGEYQKATSLQSLPPLPPLQIAANFYLQTFTLHDASALLTDGTSPAASVRQVGQGSATLLGTYLGHGTFAHKREDHTRFIQMLLTTRGVTAHRSGDITWRRRIAGNEEAWIFSNLSDKRATLTIDLGCFKSLDCLDGLALSGAGSTRELTLEAMDYGVLRLTR
jgi:beta-galactosidase